MEKNTETMNNEIVATMGSATVDALRLMFQPAVEAVDPVVEESTAGGGRGGRTTVGLQHNGTYGYWMLDRHLNPLLVLLIFFLLLTGAVFFSLICC